MEYKRYFSQTQKRLDEIEMIQEKLKTLKKNKYEDIWDEILKDAQTKKISLRRLIKGVEN